MKNNFVIFIILLLNSALCLGQERNNSILFEKMQVEAAYIMDPFYKGNGALFKVKREVMNKKHLESYTGLSAQFMQNNEDKFSANVDGYTRDLGLYLVSDWRYYPLKAKNVFIGLEPFMGVSTMKSQGSLSIPEHQVSEKYSNSYSYFNYGATFSVGYNFGRVSTNIFAMASLKGMLDGGRTRPVDSDSKTFVGINVGYKLK
jgi:hypothetical protein